MKYINEEFKTLVKSRSFLMPAGLVAIGCLIYFSVFAAPNKNSASVQFMLSPAPNEEQITKNYGVSKLKSEGFIKNSLGFKIAFALKGGKEIMPGAYQISKSMNAWEMAGIFSKEPNMKWIVIPEGLRKEQIADILAEELDWNPRVKSTWVNELSAMKFDEVEGVYFPDSYLIPVDETPLKIANRLRANFNDKFEPYLSEALKQNIQWTTVLKVASLVQREAASSNDMPLIAGIIWNRLDRGMKLEIDATIQYVRDSRDAYEGPCEDLNPIAQQQNACDVEGVKQPYTTYVGISDWWKPITPEDKSLDSKYNTYLYKGLPPHPIANPGLDAIKAVLNPAETECIFYLHDPLKNIYCAKTYAEHQGNIEKYLR